MVAATSFTSFGPSVYEHEGRQAAVHRHGDGKSLFYICSAFHHLFTDTFQALRSPFSPVQTSAPSVKKRPRLSQASTAHLKKWMEIHSDHPYANEEEKRQLCAETGLSVAKVSVWLQNVCFTLDLSIMPLV